MKAVVSRLGGAIGYVTSDQLDASVQALTIDGRSYRDPNYLLRGN